MRSRVYRDMTQKMQTGKSVSSSEMDMWTMCIRVQKSCFPPNKNSINSPLLQGNEEQYRLNTETSDKNRWGSSLRKLSYLPALRLLLDLCEDMWFVFIDEPQQLISPEKETKKRTFISYLPIHFAYTT